MNQIKIGAIISYFTVAFNIISGLFFTPFLISKVGNNVYGIYTLVITFLNYFLIDFGLGNSVSKYISLYRAQGKKKKVNEFISVVFKLFLAMAFIIGVVLFILYFFLESFFSGLTADEIVILKKMYIISGGSAVLLFIFIPLDGILTAYEKFFELKSCELLRKIGIIVLSVMALEIKCDIILVSTINAIVGVVVVIMKMGIIKNEIPIKIRWKYFDNNIFAQVASFSGWLTLIMIAQRFIIPIAPTILGRFSNSDEIGIFSIATTVEGYIYTIASCLNGLFLPKLTQMLVKKQNKEINRLFIDVGRIQSMVIGTIVACFCVYGKEFIYIWVGREFEKAYWVILLLIIPSIIVYAQEVANSILIIEHKKLKYKAGCYIVGAVISTITACMLTPKLGSIGAGIGITICLWGCHVIAMNMVYAKKTMLNIKEFFSSCYNKLIPVLFGLILVGFLINRYIETDNLIVLGIKIICFILIEMIICWKIVLNSEEKRKIMQLMKKQENLE